MNRALRIAIAASGRRQKDIARRAHIHESRLSRIVAEDVTPRPVERRRLARILGAPVEHLFEEAS